jgi:tetratricopeptide (TPR) repeat protein
MIRSLHPRPLNFFSAFAILFISIFYISSCKGDKKTGPSKSRSNDTTVSVDPDQQLKELNKKIAADAQNASLYHDRSLIFLNRGEKQNALNDIFRALSIDSTNVEYIYTKGEIYFNAMRIDEAKENFEKCLKIDPKYYQAELKLAKIYLMIKDFNESMRHINNALKVDKTIAEGYFLKGSIYEMTGDSAKAASSFQTAVEQKTDYYDAFISLGLLYAAAHNDLAIEYYNSALAIRPKSIEALYNLAMFYQENNRYDEAFATYDQILLIDPSIANAVHNKGYIYLVYLEDYAKAITEFDKALKINQGYISAYHNRGLAYLELKKFKEARADFKTALQLDPQYELSANELDRMDRLHQ